MKIKDNKLKITTEWKTVHFALSKNVGNNELIALHTLKNKTAQLLSKNKHGNDIHEQRKQ